MQRIWHAASCSLHPKKGMNGTAVEIPFAMDRKRSSRPPIPISLAKMNKPISVPDVIVRLHLRKSEDGGRRQPIRAYEAHDYGCLLWIDAEYFDCRWLLAEDETLDPGTQHRIAIKFLDRSLVNPLLAIGKQIKMWEGKVIADGFIEEICF